jgi:hypothetical protein
MVPKGDCQMRVVTNEIRRAFYNGKQKKIKNTETDGQNVYLHGNCIVKRVNGKVFISTHGWNTVTTRERLRAFTNKSLYQKNWILYLDGIEWNGDWTEA